MKNEIGRRRWLQAISAMGAAGASGYLSEVLAAGDLPPGLHRVDGTAAVNGKPVQSGAKVNLGDRVATGKGSSAVVVMKGDAFLMRADTVIGRSDGRDLATARVVARSLCGTLRYAS
jgi:hypothetical protein